MPTERFPAHRRPNLSKLDPYKDQIASMRGQSWPYRRILEWLEGQGITIAYESLRRFCIRRNITNGMRTVQRSQRPTQDICPAAPPMGLPSSSPPSPNSEVMEVQPEPPRKRFSYDDSKPIRTRKDRLP